MDIKTLAEDLINQLKNDPAMMDKFLKEPVPVVEKLIGMDLPDDQIMKVVELVKAKINIDKATAVIGGLSGLFRK